jgi:hypothetical protein
MSRLRYAIPAIGIFALASTSQAVALTGTWSLYPPQTQTVPQVSVDPPINADGSSVWAAKSVVAVQYDLLLGYGPVVFSSYQTPYTYSSLDFRPSSALTFAQLTTLTAGYAFTTGTCHGGALRWSIVFSDGSTIFIYYGKDATFWSDCSSNPNDPSIDQSGLNMINANFDGTGGDVRYERSDHPGSYTTYASVLSFAAGKTISDVILVLDSGWGGDQVISPLGHVTVNDNTFVPNSGTTSVCPSQPATIQVSKIGPSGSLTIDEDLTSIQNDTGSQFRIVDCKYKYNIAGKSLSVGQYKVDAIINGSPAYQQAPGTIFGLK